MRNRSVIARHGVFGEEVAAPEVHTETATEEPRISPIAPEIDETGETDISAFIKSDDGFLPRRDVCESAIKKHRAMLEDHTKL